MSGDVHAELNRQSDQLRRAIARPRSFDLMEGISRFFDDIRVKAPWWVDQTWFPVIDWDPFL